MSLSGWVEPRYRSTVRFYPQTPSLLDCVYKYSSYVVIFTDGGSPLSEYSFVRNISTQMDS